MRTAHVIGLIFPLLWGGNVSFSQQWQDAGIIGYAPNVRILYADSLNNHLYAGGMIYPNNIPPIQWDRNYLCKYDLGLWDTIAYFSDQILSIHIHNGELYVGGFFTEVNGMPAMHLAKFDGNNWINIGNFNGVVGNIKEINNELYVMGSFTEVNSIPINGIARWSINGWEDVYNFQPDFATICDIAFYQGNLYIAGNFAIHSDTIHDIAVYKNGAWQKVGTTDYIRGSIGDVRSLAIFNNELYAGGMILKNQGNVGYLLQKWNGQNWSQVGLGLKDNNYNTNSNGYVNRIVIKNNLLVVCGLFYYAGNILTQNIGFWDGYKWCGNSYTNVTQPITNIVFMQDTLYAASYINQVNSISYGVVRWSETNYFDTCGSALNVSEFKPTQTEINIYPNPNNGNFNIVFSSAYNKPVAISVYNNLGQCVYSKKLNSVGAGELVNLNIEELSGGMYFVNIETENNMHTLKMALQK
jgi:hypothetical protein